MWNFQCHTQCLNIQAFSYLPRPFVFRWWLHRYVYGRCRGIEWFDFPRGNPIRAIEICGFIPLDLNQENQEGIQALFLGKWRRTVFFSTN
jgi:hypothetical protein